MSDLFDEGFVQIESNQFQNGCYNPTQFQNGQQQQMQQQAPVQQQQQQTPMQQQQFTNNAKAILQQQIPQQQAPQQIAQQQQVPMQPPMLFGQSSAPQNQQQIQPPTLFGNASNRFGNNVQPPSPVEGINFIPRSNSIFSPAPSKQEPKFKDTKSEQQEEKQEQDIGKKFESSDCNRCENKEKSGKHMVVFKDMHPNTVYVNNKTPGSTVTITKKTLTTEDKEILSLMSDYKWYAVIKSYSSSQIKKMKENGTDESSAEDVKIPVTFGVDEKGEIEFYYQHEGYTKTLNVDACPLFHSEYPWFSFGLLGIFNPGMYVRQTTTTTTKTIFFPSLKFRTTTLTEQLGEDDVEIYSRFTKFPILYYKDWNTRIKVEMVNNVHTYHFYTVRMKMPFDIFTSKIYY